MVHCTLFIQYIHIYVSVLSLQDNFPLLWTVNIFLFFCFPILTSIHQLTVDFRNDCKILLITWISAKVHLRYHDTTSQSFELAFSVMAQLLWNNLPEDIRLVSSLSSLLKTYFYEYTVYFYAILKLSYYHLNHVKCIIV